MMNLLYGILLLIALFALFASTEAGAKTFQLGTHTAEQVHAKCTRVHGTFYSHTDAFGCAFSKGTVQCTTDGHCAGYQKRRPVQALPPAQPEWHGGIPPENQWREPWLQPNQRW
jgi:hypothetical protein